MDIEKMKTTGKIVALTFIAKEIIEEDLTVPEVLEMLEEKTKELMERMENAEDEELRIEAISEYAAYMATNDLINDRGMDIKSILIFINKMLDEIG